MQRHKAKEPKNVGTIIIRYVEFHDHEICDEWIKVKHPHTKETGWQRCVNNQPSTSINDGLAPWDAIIDQHIDYEIKEK